MSLMTLHQHANVRCSQVVGLVLQVARTKDESGVPVEMIKLRNTPIYCEVPMQYPSYYNAMSIATHLLFKMQIYSMSVCANDEENEEKRHPT